MSRIGNNPVAVPEGVTVDVKDNVITVKGKLGELTQEYSDVTIKVEDGNVIFERPSDFKDHRAKHGLYRSLVYNMIEGVSKGWSKELELVGVGYRASNQGQKLDLALGFSHNIVLDIAPEVKVETVSEKGKNPIVKLTSFDKQLVGQVAAKIRGFRKPEPYKGKGVKFVGEQIRRKAGKTISGTEQRPRLAVFRSNKEIYAQLIDDVSGKTITAASSRDKDIDASKVNKVEAAKLVGKAIAEKAQKAGVETVSFDRGGYLYHGRVKSLAEGAREGGLKF